MVNLSSFIHFHALRDPERLALVYDGQRITYGELYERIQSLAGYLAARGVAEDDVVAVFMKNSAAFYEICFAASHLGAVFLPINFRLSQDEFRFIVENSDAKLVFADLEFAPVVDGVPNTVLLDEAAQRDGRTLSRGDVPPAAEMRVRKPGDLFRLMYTSGTTDRPKGVMHTYENFYWKCMDHIISLGMTAQDRMLTVGPLYHVGAFDLPGIALWWLGGSIHLHRAFDEADALADIAREQITCAWFAPVMVGRLLTLTGQTQLDLSSFKWCIAGGERTPENRIRDFTKLFPNARFIDGYGLTESCSGDTLMEPGREIEKIGSTGRALAHVEVTVRDDAGKILPALSEGEICLRGPKITKGYWKDPNKTAASFHAEWFRTGDIGYLDDDGFLFLTDRKKDMIISGGENIASSEVERIIYQMPEVAECAVIGLPDPRWGERPVAIIVLKPGETLTLETVQARCRGRLASFKVPKDVVVRNELPRNPSGKVLKRLLREQLHPSTP